MKTINKIEAVSNSHELFELINEHRILAGKKPMNKHSELVNKIKDELGDLHGKKKIAMQIETNNGGSRSMDVYELSRRDVFLVSMRESKEVRSSIYDYIEALEQDVWTMYNVITSKGFLGQELGLKCAGIKHPRLFMEMVNTFPNWTHHITTKNDYFGSRRVGKNPDDTILAWSKEGFQWLLRNKEVLNERVASYVAWRSKNKVVA